MAHDGSSPVLVLHAGLVAQYTCNNQADANNQRNAGQQLAEPIVGQKAERLNREQHKTEDNAETKREILHRF